MVYTVSKVGRRLMVTVPADQARLIGLEAGQQVECSVQGGCLVYEPFDVQKRIEALKAEICRLQRLPMSQKEMEDRYADVVKAKEGLEAALNGMSAGKFVPGSEEFNVFQVNVFRLSCLESEKKDLERKMKEVK